MIRWLYLTVILVIQMIIMSSILSLGYYFTEARSSSDQFTTVNDCTCEGDTLIYECTVFGGVATVWKGTSFDCSATNNEVVIFHSINSTSQGAKVCNDGAITGRVIMVENDTYTSQLTVQVSTEMNGSTISCAYDNGIDTPVIGSTLLTLTIVPYPPPNDVKLVEANNTHLSFNWSQVAMSCPSIQYHIVASNCGQYPNTTTNTTVTCSGNYLKLLKDQQCSFAVQTVVCDGIAGDVSTAVNITIRSLDLNPVMADGDSRLEAIITLIISVAVISVIVLMGISLTLGLALVYLLSKKSSRAKKNTTNQWSTQANTDEVELDTVDNSEQVQGAGVHSYPQSTAEDEDHNPDSRSRTDMIYADIGPRNAVEGVFQQTITLIQDDLIQYEEIRHNTEAPVCKQLTTHEISVNLDLLLNLLKEEITPRWYEFGLVVGVPKGVMDSYTGYPSDQCLIELLDYWLRYHPGQLTWREVAQALKEIELYQLAEKALQISVTGKFPFDPDIARNFDFRQRNNQDAKQIPPNIMAESGSGALSHTPRNLKAAAKLIPAPEYEDTAGLLPPPLPPKNKDI